MNTLDTLLQDLSAAAERIAREWLALLRLVRAAIATEDYGYGYHTGFAKWKAEAEAVLKRIEEGNR